MITGKKKSGFVFILLMAVSILAAACGGGNTDTSAPTERKGYAQGVTDTEIKVGWWGPQSGPAAAWGTLFKGADAYFKMVNENGGINGRKITYIAVDDEYQPSKTIAAAKKLVEVDRVFATVASIGTAHNEAAKPYMQEKNILNIYASGSSKLSNPPEKTMFSVIFNYTAEANALAKYTAEDLGKKKIGLFYQNDDFGKEGLNGVKSELEKKGMKLVAEVPYNTNNVDYSTPALKFKEAGADAVILYGAPKPLAALAKELHKIGSDAQLVATAIVADPVMFDLAGSAWEGAIVANYPPVIDGNNSKVKDFVEAFNKYYPNDKPGTFAQYGWLAAQIFTEGVKRAGDDLTTEGMIKALESFGDWDGSIVGTVTYTPDNHMGPSSLYFMRAQNNQLVKISDEIEVIAQ